MDLYVIQWVAGDGVLCAISVAGTSEHVGELVAALKLYGCRVLLGCGYGDVTGGYWLQWRQTGERVAHEATVRSTDYAASILLSALENQWADVSCGLAAV